MMYCEGKTLYCVSIFTHSQSHTHTHSLSLVLVVMIKSKELKTKISHTHSLILSHCVSLPLCILSTRCSHLLPLSHRVAHSQHILLSCCANRSHCWVCQWVVEPMQIDTHNREYDINDPVGYKPSFLPKRQQNNMTQLNGGLSPLIECPCPGAVDCATDCAADCAADWLLTAQMLLTVLLTVLLTAQMLSTVLLTAQMLLTVLPTDTDRQNRHCHCVLAILSAYSLHIGH